MGKGSYRRLNVTVGPAVGEAIPAITYVIPNPVVPFQPTPEYTRPILMGARALRLPLEYVAELEAIVQRALES